MKLLCLVVWQWNDDSDSDDIDYDGTELRQMMMRMEIVIAGFDSYDADIDGNFAWLRWWWACFICLYDNVMIVLFSRSDFIVIITIIIITIISESKSRRPSRSDLKDALGDSKYAWFV